MGTVLLDINVLLAVGWPNHAQYSLVHQWMKSIGEDRWATCPITQCGFVRLGSNKKVIPEATTPESAMLLLRSVVSDHRHVFWHDDLPLYESPLRRERMQGHNQIMDAYLLSLCLKRGARLATFDRGILSLASTEHERATVWLLSS